jgi:Holliday junction resolvase RusA-like endonuclease
MISFFVAGLPKTMKVGGVARFQRGDKVHMVPKRGNTDWALLVGQVGRTHAPRVPAEGPLVFVATFYMPRPARARKADVVPLKRPDLDNLLHKLTDQFNAVFWQDDSQVVELVARKRFATDREDRRTGVEITIAPFSFVSAAKKFCSGVSTLPLSTGSIGSPALPVDTIVDKAVTRCH